IIFIGLGLALAFEASGLKAAAALSLTAAIFHVFNHSLFKSLLFLGSGAVLHATGERDMERLGGLIHRMPVTALAFLAGCIAISALPPFNGFVSEWLTFQAILLSPQLPQWVPRLIVPAVGATLACAAALAATCFVKAFGMIAIAAAATALIVRRFASHALRRAPAWDCGFPDASPATQYTAGSFAQPIRRVFGGVVFRAREHVTMPAPGDTGPARLEVELH